MNTSNRFTSEFTWLHLLALACGMGFAPSACAATTDFSDGWLFHLGEVPGAEAKTFADASWEKIRLPHPARLEALVTDKDTKQQWEGICWYRKTFTLPAEATDQVVLLRFEGAMNLAQLFVNGEKLAEHADGYLPFVADLSACGKTSGAITLAMRLDNRHSDLTGPKPLPILDFHLYHGLYRNASLIIKPTIYITDEILENKPASGGVFVTYPQVTDTSATVDTQVHIRNSSKQDAAFSILTKLSDLNGTEIARQETTGLKLDRGDDRVFNSRIEVREPRLWSPQSPNLYYLDVALVSSGKVIESRRERIGIRRIKLEPGGVVINGKKLFLRGVNRHQEYPYVGNAVPANAQYRDALKIKQAGFDFVRLAHSPQSPDFMAACDELGLVVMDPILGWQFNPGTAAFKSNRIEAARALVRRDRNHPSAILWELSLNESSMTADFIQQLHMAGHEEYPGDQAFIAGWIKGYDVKISARQHNSTREFQSATFPCLVSEYGDWEYYAQNAGLNQDNWKNLKNAERSSRQQRGDGEIRLLQQAANIQEAHNENRGTKAFADAYWVMYDYNRGYASDLEASGDMDIFRLPKFSYYFFQSQRDPSEVLAGRAGGPMVFAATYWTENSPLNVRVYSNCEEVELILNGQSLGRQKPDQNRMSTNLPHPPFTFKVGQFQPGELKAVAYLNGKAAAQHLVKNPGAPKRIELAIDLSGKPLSAGGDLVFVYARIVDANGTVVPSASWPVKFEVNGDAQLIGDNPIAAEAGIATILLKTGLQVGPLSIKATAEGLQGNLDSKISANN
jgi:beta-galactosidase